jgi:hypothetical protein
MYHGVLYSSHRQTKQTARTPEAALTLTDAALIGPCPFIIYKFEDIIFNRSQK